MDYFEPKTVSEALSVLAKHGAEATRLLERARGVLAAFLHDQGAGDVHIHCCTGRAPHRARSGKVQRVIASTSQ